MQENPRRNVGLLVVTTTILVSYLVYSQFLASPPDTSSENAATTEPDAAAQRASDETPPAISAAEQAPPATRVRRTIRTAHFEAVVDNLGGGLAGLLIVGDPRFRDRERDEPLDLIRVDRDEYQSLRLTVPGSGLPDDAVWRLEEISATEVRMVWEGPDVRIVRTLEAGRGPYQLWSTVRLENTGKTPRRISPRLSSFHYVARSEESGGILPSRSTAISHGLCRVDGETVRKDRDTLASAPHAYAGNVAFAAVENSFFVQAMAPHGAQPADRCAMLASDRGNPDPVGTLFESRLVYPYRTLSPGASLTYQTLAYLGPKVPDALNAAGHELSEVVDLGWLALISQQFARLLSWIHSWVGNWGLAIILLTVLMRLAMAPLTHRMFKSMARMRQLKPEIDRINELYADDRERKGAAIWDLYRKHNVNPLGGCLPQLIQLPVWWALYTSLSTNIELYHMPFALWWDDLTAPDPFFTLPAALGLLMHIQQRLQPTNMDPAQARMMMWMMPIMITVFMLFLPSGLCLYMLTNSVLAIAQQHLNERLLQRQAAPTQSAASEPTDPPVELDGGDGEGPDSGSTQKRLRPKRTGKRRTRRGRT